MSKYVHVFIVCLLLHCSLIKIFFLLLLIFFLHLFCNQTRNILINNPSLAYMLLQAQILMNMVTPDLLTKLLKQEGGGSAGGAGGAGGAAAAAATAGSVSEAEMQRQLFEKVGSLTVEQIRSLPDGNREQ